MVSTLPLAGYGGSIVADVVTVDGGPLASGDAPLAVHLRATSPGYHDLMGMKIVARRGSRPSDTNEGLRVAVLNENAAERFFPARNALGSQITVALASDTLEHTVVGILADACMFGGDTLPRPEAFVPFRQLPTEEVTLVAAAPPGGRIPPDRLRRLAGAADSSVPVETAGTLRELTAYGY